MNTLQASNRLYSLDEVVEILHSILAQRGDETEKNQKLHTDLTLLAYYIQNARSELTQIRAMNTKEHLVQTTTDELDAVISETIRATAVIMDACEDIEAAAGTAENQLRDRLVKAATSIYEACSFQDITGQRITKVIRTMKTIEKRVAESLASFGPLPVAPSLPHGLKQDNNLLNGPQLKGPAMSQEEIDNFVNFFDK